MDWVIWLCYPTPRCFGGSLAMSIFSAIFSHNLTLAIAGIVVDDVHRTVYKIPTVMWYSWITPLEQINWLQ